MKLAAAALGLLLASCGGADPGERALYITGKETFRFSEAASARLKGLVARAPSPVKGVRIAAEPIGWIKVGEATFEFHGSMLRWVDADHVQSIQDPMLEHMWGGGAAPGKPTPVELADDWLQRHP